MTVICGLALLAWGFYCSGKQNGQSNSYDCYIRQLKTIEGQNEYPGFTFINISIISSIKIPISAGVDTLISNIREVLEIKQKQNRDWKQMSFTTILTGAGLVGGAVLQAQPLLIGACACGVFTLFRSLYLHGQSASIQRSIENKLLSIRSSLNQNLASVNREIERYNRQIEYFSKK